MQTLPTTTMHLLAALTAAVALAGTAAPPPTLPPLPPHPRLILTQPRIAALSTLIATDADARALLGALQAHAEWILTQPPIAQQTPGASGVLIPVRAALDFALSSAAAAALVGGAAGARYAARGEAELLSLAAWTTWNPPHFLDVAEASAAVALGYDWLYGAMNASARATVAASLAEKGAAAYVASFASHSWPQGSTSNWNCVCSAGGMLLALALGADVAAGPPAWPGVFLPSLASIPQCAGAYGPEGSWEEGVGYWGYGSKYIALLLGAMDSALGTEYGLGDTAGLSLAGRFPIFTAGASAQFYDWADSWPFFTVAYGDWNHSIAPYQSFFGSRFSDPAVTYFARAYTSAFASASVGAPAWAGLVEALLYFSADGSAADLAALPSAHLYAERNVGAFAGGPAPWTAVAAPSGGSSLHFKGGCNSYGHGHLDLGGWVYDLRGVRVVEDEGADNYDLPDYFGPQRWRYARLNSAMHNVPRFDGASQSPSACARIGVFNASEAALRGGGAAGAPSAFATADLSAGYAAGGAVAGAARGWAAFGAATSALVVDEFVWGANVSRLSNVTVALHTHAAVVIAGDGRSATLTMNATGGEAGAPALVTHVALLGGAALARGGSCAGARLVAESVALAPPQYPTAGTTRLSALAAPGAGCTRIAVVVGDALPPSGWALRPLGEWEASGPVGPG